MPELTPVELGYLLSGPQKPRVEWYLALAPYGDPCFTARVNGDPATPRTIIYDNGVGTNVPTEHYADLTLWVGSAPGARDLGTVRIRDITGPGGAPPPAVGTLTVAENDDIAWSDDLYLTCPGAWGFREIRSKYPRMTEAAGVVTFYKDYSMLYFDEGDHLPPKANAGPPTVGWINPDTGLATLHFLGGGSFATELGETITTWNWVFPGGNPGVSALQGTRTDPVEVTWDTPGMYYVRLQVTDSLGTTGHTYIAVWIFEEGVVDPYEKVEVRGQSGSVSAGWNAQIRVFDVEEANLYDFPEGAMGVVFTKTWYGGVRADIGKYLGPAASDEGVLTYDPGGVLGLQDDAQDFAPWETVVGDSTFLVLVDNTDGTRAWGYLGGAWGVGDINVSVYTDVEGDVAGWNGERVGKTPDTYRVWEVSVAPGNIGRGNIRFAGWLSRESLDFDFEKGTCDFTLVSSDGRMRVLPAFSFTLETDATPGDWYEMQDLCVDRAVMHLLEFHSTVNQVCHVNVTWQWGQRTMAIQVFPDTSLYTQAQEHLMKDVMCLMLADHKGIIRSTFDPQMRSAANRDLVPVTCSIDAEGWRDDIEQVKSHVPRVGSIQLGGFHDETPLLSRAPATALSVMPIAPLQQENEESVDGVILTGQVEANLWSGLALGKRNNPYPTVPIGMNGYWPVFDPAYQEWFRLTATDPLNRNTLDEQRFVPREVSFDDRRREHTSLTDMTVEMEAPIMEGITQIIPEIEPDPPDPPLPPDPPPPPPPPEWVILHSKERIFRTANFLDANPVWEEVTNGIVGWICTVELDQYNHSGCWAVTGTDGFDGGWGNVGHGPDNGNTTGVWYSPNIDALVPGAVVWNLVFTQLQGETNAWPAPVNGACAFDDYWGQLRSLISIGTGKAMVLESKWKGIVMNAACAGMRKMSTTYVVDSGGGFYRWGSSNMGGIIAMPYQSSAGAARCSLVTCHTYGSYAWRNSIANEKSFRSSHQLERTGPNAAGTSIQVHKGYYCWAGDAPCPAATYYLRIRPLPSWPWLTMIRHYEDDEWDGARHVVKFQGGWYGVTELGPNAAHRGTIYRASDGVVVAENIYADALGTFQGFCNVCATYSHLYWCISTGVGLANQVTQGGTPMAALDSEVLFGSSGITWWEGQIGHIRSFPGDRELLFVVRKDEIEAAQPNKSIIYWYDSNVGALDKTGNLPVGWRGTGNRVGVGLYSYNFDNVGVSAIGIYQYGP